MFLCFGPFILFSQSHIKWAPHAPPTENSSSVGPRPQTGQASLTFVCVRSHLCREGEAVCEQSLSSQDSNSLSLLTEISGVEAPVPLRSVSVLQSLASGLPRWRGEVGSKWGWWRRSWREPSGELSEGRREGSCCSLCRGRDKRDESEVPDWREQLFRQILSLV